MAVCLRKLRTGVSVRAFATCPFAEAAKVHATPYDEAKEGPIGFRPYDGMEKCTWKLGTTEKSPHTTVRPRRNQKIAASALELIGDTPMVRLTRLQKHLGLECELIGKMEMFNAGGSVKDRIALRMIEEAERSGRIKPGDVIIEPTSGNTGVGLCMAGALKGYKVIITMPMKMSGEKLNTMKALGASILRTPTEAGWNDTNSHIALALRLQKILPNAHVLDQYENPGNPLAHYDGTAEEILEQTGGDFDVIVLAAGTGGTLTGIARKIKEKKPNCTVVGVDPKGSILAIPDSLNDCPDHPRLTGYHVEGIGYDFIPTVLERELADVWVKTSDNDAFKCSRSLIRHEGLLVGGSSGSCLAGALQYIEQQGGLKGKKVVCLFADSVRNYMSKFLDDQWLDDNKLDKTIL